jgi:alcohol dehydrogenase, propanol-preferring
MGMRPIVIDTGEQKKKLCLELGADEFIDFKEHSDVAARVKEIAGGVGAHGVLVTAYQAYKGTQTAFVHIRRSETILTGNR